MIDERVVRRVLSAVRFVDVSTGLMIRNRLRITASEVDWVWNRSGFLVLLDAPGMHEITTADDPPATPAPGNSPVTLTVVDPSRRFLGRQVVVPLPRDPDKEHASQKLSIFQAVNARMFLAPGAVVGTNWAAVRASVVLGGKPAPNVLVKVSPAAGGDAIGSGLTDEQGQGLVGMPGVAAIAMGNGAAVLSHGMDVNVSIFAVPPAGPGNDPSNPGPPDTDAIETAASGMAQPTATQAKHIDPGREISVEFSLP
jgi:hypothetical protein